jgi:hypothetical protein
VKLDDCCRNLGVEMRASANNICCGGRGFHKGKSCAEERISGFFSNLLPFITCLDQPCDQARNNRTKMCETPVLPATRVPVPQEMYHEDTTINRHTVPCNGNDAPCLCLGRTCHGGRHEQRRYEYQPDIHPGLSGFLHAISGSLRSLAVYMRTLHLRHYPL